jgi:hypothetical protein
MCDETTFVSLLVILGSLIGAIGLIMFIMEKE